VVEEPTEPTLSPDLELTVLERLALTSFQLTMMQADLAVESAASKQEVKRRDLDAEVMRAIGTLRSLPPDLPPWARDFRQSTAAFARDQVRTAFCEAAESFGATIVSRPRAMMVLIDVVMFNPWSGSCRWKTANREAQLTKVAGYLPPLEPRDLANIQREHGESVRAVKQRSTKLGEYSVSQLAKLPDSIAEAIASVAVWLKSFDTDVVDSAVRADLMTRLVAINAEQDEEKARRVVQSIQERLAVLVQKQEALTAKLGEMRSLNFLLSAENRELRKQLQEERERAQIAEAALATALDHIFGAVPTLPATLEDGT
jgi:hypothetical protein